MHYLQIELPLLARDMEWTNTIVLENTTTRVLGIVPDVNVAELVGEGDDPFRFLS